ncbi:MAG: sensor histidine kinase, partial [Pyrinomonadaceae bacterium]
VIYSAGENLADGVTKDREQISRYGDLIKGEGKKLSGMVEQIMEFAGARSGRKKYNFADVDIVEIAGNAIEECQPELEENGFEVESELANVLPSVSGDAEALSSAIQNLIRNSVKYSSGSRWVRISAENGNSTIKIAVEDRGIGIAAGDLNKVFEPFYRAKEVVDAQIHGNGLGLSLVKEIAEAHGGSVKVISEIGKGSKFTIEIPLRVV